MVKDDLSEDVAELLISEIASRVPVAMADKEGPWKLLASPDAYIFGWLIGYSGLLGPVAGIMVTDYFLIRKTELDMNSLYHTEGAYHYSRGINPRAIVSLALGVTVALIGLLVHPLHFLYDYAWFVGFFISGAVYVGLMKLTAPATVGELETAQAGDDAA